MPNFRNVEYLKESIDGWEMRNGILNLDFIETIMEIPNPELSVAKEFVGRNGLAIRTRSGSNVIILGKLSDFEVGNNA
jgi:hypothetical protein